VRTCKIKQKRQKKKKGNHSAFIIRQTIQEEENKGVKRGEKKHKEGEQFNGQEKKVVKKRIKKRAKKEDSRRKIPLTLNYL
jgi:hypothetical protein